MKTYALSLTSAFSTTSLLKARIMMLYRKPSAKFALAKFGFALPALVLCILISSFLQKKISNSNDKLNYYFVTRMIVKSHSKSEFTHFMLGEKTHLFRFINPKTSQNIEPSNLLSLQVANYFDKKVQDIKEYNQYGLLYKPNDTGIGIVKLHNKMSEDVEIIIYRQDIEKKGSIYPEILPTIPLSEKLIPNRGYPKNIPAYQKDIEGTVITSVVVNLDGTLSDVKIEQSLGSGCDEIALKNIENQKDIRAGKDNGKDVQTKIKIKTIFERYPEYFDKPQPIANIMKIANLADKELVIKLEEGKIYIFNLTETQDLSEKELQKINFSISCDWNNTVVSYDSKQNKYFSVAYKPKRTANYRISLGETATMKAGKLVIGTK